MRAINAAYGVLSDPARRAVYDARRYLQPPTNGRVSRAGAAASWRSAPTPPPPVTTANSARRQPSRAATSARQPGSWPATSPSASRQPGPRRVAADVVAEPPTALQRRVDRIVAVVGVLLLLAIGAYAALVIPRSEQEFQDYVRGIRSIRPTAAAPAQSSASSDAHSTSTSVPERLRSDSGLRSFPGTVLVAPSTLEPFADLPVLRLDAAAQGIARYAVYYGDLTNGGATISGLVGRTSFDSATPQLPDCAPDAAYCSGPAPGQPRSAPAGVELFRAADLVETYPAFVTHRVCCNGVAWSVSWYEPRANMSYTIDLFRSVAARYGSPHVNADIDAARTVAALTTRLVRLP